MGHRATYAIREDGEVELFYSHWGALTVPEDVFWGPAAAEAFIRANQESDGWLDDVWGEGGIGLNKDEKVVAWFGGETLGYGVHRELFTELMSALWGQWGWEVRAVDGMPDIAEAVGVERAIAEADPIEPWAVDPEELGEQWLDPQTRSYFGLLTTVDEDGATTRVLDCGISPFLAAGDAVLDHLDQLPPLEDVLQYHAQRPLDEWEEEAERRAPVTNYVNSGAVVDRTRKRVSFFGIAGSEYELDFFRKRWPDWEMRLHDEGFPGHFERAGVPMPEEFTERQWWGGDDDATPAAELSEDELLEEIAHTLLGERSDPVEFMKRVTRSLEDDNEGEVWVNPDAMVSPPESRPGDPEEIFGQALAALVRTRNGRG